MRYLPDFNKQISSESQYMDILATFNTFQYKEENSFAIFLLTPGCHISVAILYITKSPLIGIWMYETYSITLTLAAAALILSGCCRHSDFLKTDYMNHVSQFYDCSFVDWDSFTDVNQYSSDWGQEADALIHESWKGHNAASVYWDRLQNAKTIT